MVARVGCELVPNSGPALIVDQGRLLAGGELTPVRYPAGVNWVREQCVEMTARKGLAAPYRSPCFAQDSALEQGGGRDSYRRRLSAQLRLTRPGGRVGITVRDDPWSVDFGLQRRARRRDLTRSVRRNRRAPPRSPAADRQSGPDTPRA